METNNMLIENCILYRDFEDGAILYQVTELMMRPEKMPEGPDPHEQIGLRRQMNDIMSGLIETAGECGFEGNLWHAYLTNLMVNHDNAFSRACEMRSGATGSINAAALHDFKILKRLFDYPLGDTAKALGIDCSFIIDDYVLSEGQGKAYNTRICSRILDLTKELECADSAETFMDCVTQFYSEYGVGTFGLHKAFRVEKVEGHITPDGGPGPGMGMMMPAPMMPRQMCPPPRRRFDRYEEVQLPPSGARPAPEDMRHPQEEENTADQGPAYRPPHHPPMPMMPPAPRPVRRTGASSGSRVRIIPINNVAHVTLDDLVGYEYAKQQLIENTEAFIAGRPSNNCLLYGDAGTGKSSSIKAIMNKYYDQGLRLIELYKHQFRDLNAVIAQIKNRNYRFIIYLDDLSFEEFETDYKYLKAVIEGDLEQRPDNIRIYATSNRRHLVRESTADRSDTDEDLHSSDTVQEKISLSARFGKQIYFGKPTPQEFRLMVKILARKQGVEMEEKELLRLANQWEIKHGGYSGRAAQQFIDDLKGRGY